MTLVFATHNPNKVTEIQSLMPSHIQIKSLTDIDCHDEIIEDAPTIKGNAILKAKFVKEKFGYDCFADDTGLQIEVLNNEPGVLSARYAGEHKNASDNIEKVLHELKGVKNRNARFKTVIALALNDELYTFEGICIGEIIEMRKGEGGFGYDPIFKPDGYKETFAQLSLSVKNQISHRGLAVQKLLNFIKQQDKL